MTFWEIAGTRNVVFYNTKSSPKVGRVRSRQRRVRDDDFIVGSGRIWSDLVGSGRISSDVVGLSSNRLSIGGSIQGVSAEILSLQDFVAGAVFGEVGR